MAKPAKADAMDSGRRTPGAPCWAVIFTSTLSEDTDGYAETAERMLELAHAQPGFLGVERSRDAQGRGVTVSYWASREAITAWRKHPEHARARAEGRRRWYSDWKVQIERIDAPAGGRPPTAPDP